MRVRACVRAFGRSFVRSFVTYLLGLFAGVVMLLFLQRGSSFLGRTSKSRSMLAVPTMTRKSMCPPLVTNCNGMTRGCAWVIAWVIAWVS